MKLVIMRHGQAQAFAESDAARCLTEKGRADVAYMASALKDRLLPLDESTSPASFRVFHSPYCRTTQTAEQLAEAWGKGDVPAMPFLLTPAEQLLGSCSPQAASDWLENENAHTVILVSHQPLVSSLVAWLTEGVSGNLVHQLGHLRMAPASAAILSGDAPGRGTMAMDIMLHAPV